MNKHIPICCSCVADEKYFNRVKAWRDIMWEYSHSLWAFCDGETDEKIDRVEIIPHPYYGRVSNFCFPGFRASFYACCNMHPRGFVWVENDVRPCMSANGAEEDTDDPMDRILRLYNEVEDGIYWSWDERYKMPETSIMIVKGDGPTSALKEYCSRTLYHDTCFELDVYKLAGNPMQSTLFHSYRVEGLPLNRLPRKPFDFLAQCCNE